MEEWVGNLWHRLITRLSAKDHPQARVALDEIRTPAGMMFRALGGDGGLRLESASAAAHGARRGWLARLAGTRRHVELAWRDEQVLYLPSDIALFADREHNRELYLWLAALAAQDTPEDIAQDWILRSQHQVVSTLARFPGLAARYRRLAEALIALRPDPERLPADESAQERLIRQALREPGSVPALPAARRSPQPVMLWLHPAPPQTRPVQGHSRPDTGERQDHGEGREVEDQRKRRAEHTEMPKGDEGLMAVRFENILSWGEYAKVDRTTDEDDDPDAESVANDMETMHVARDNAPAASRLRFNLDLPAAEYDDIPIGTGIPLPEWDYRKQALRPDHCHIQTMVARHATPQPLPEHLRRPARRLRSQFEALAQTRAWQHGQQDGCEPDLEAYLRFHGDKLSGRLNAAPGLYRDFRNTRRDLACLLLADLSLSTDAAVSDEARVIDVIRDSLFLFSETLQATRDRFAMYGFSSRYRDHVRVHVLKGFCDAYSAETRGRIQAVKPGYYTRMGAAIRYATQQLSKEAAERKLLLVLTDGKPNDLDVYEGRYGVEDTRMALIEARRQGLHPFCVTIDREARGYLPHLFGAGGYTVIRSPAELPRRLPALYARLTT